MKKETTIGIFIAISLMCVVYLTVKLGKMEVFGDDGYTVTAQFSSVAGLRNGASVEIAGVNVGRVTKIELDPTTYMALVDMRLEEGLLLSEDTIAAIKTSGLIGDKYVGLEPGGMEENLKEGSFILDTEPSLDIESLISKYVFGDL